MLGIKGLAVIAEDVVESAEEAQTHADLGMEGAVDVGQKIVGLGDKLVTLFQVALLDLGLTVGEEVVGVSCLGRHVLDDGVHVEDVILVEGLSVLRLEVVLTEKDLDAVLLAEGAQEGQLAELLHGEGFLVIVVTIQITIENIMFQTQFREKTTMLISNRESSHCQYLISFYFLRI